MGSSTFVLLVAAGAARGGYFPGSWGWLTLACAWVAILAVLLDTEAGLSATGSAFASLLAAYTVWTLVSAVWSGDPTNSLLEAQRNLVYVAAVGASLLVAREARGSLIAGAWLATAALCGFALLTRLVPDRFGVVDPISGYRLSEPIGYWNSLGMLAGVGALLALGVAARARSTAFRALAAATVPLFATTLYFTFSRGGWLSLFAGLVVIVALDPRRLQALGWFVPTGAAAGVALLLASREKALAIPGTPLPLQASEGHRLALWLGVIALAAAVSAVAWANIERRLTPAAVRYRGRGHAALALALVVGAITVVAVAGSPWSLVARGWHGFASSPPAGSGPSLNNHLFHLSGSGRITQWKIAWREFEAHPVVGSGAATWERFWNRDRPVGGKVRNVHNLYLEAAATLGVVGFLLLVAALLVPLATGVAGRAGPLVPFALAAYVAYLVHALVDWDWQVTGATLPVLVCAAALVGTNSRPLGRRRRGALLAVAGIIAVAGLWGIAAQTTLSRIDTAAPAKAAQAARQASDLQPWSTEPWRRFADGAITGGRYPEARAALRRALALDGGDWSLWLDLARASDGAARARALDRASALNPLSPEVAAFRQTIASLSSLGAKG